MSLRWADAQRRIVTPSIPRPGPHYCVHSQRVRVLGGLRAPQTPALYGCISIFSTALFFFTAPDLGEGLRTSPKSGARARGHHRRLAYV